MSLWAHIALSEGCIVDGQLGQPAIEAAPGRPVSAVAQRDGPVRIDCPPAIDLKHTAGRVKSQNPMLARSESELESEGHGH